MPEPKELVWLGSALEDIRMFPDEVRREVGFALREAQNGKKHRGVKPLKSFRGASVIEIIEDFDSNAYRAVYTVRFPSAIYVLHCFQKKSKSGIATPQQDINLIRQRMKRAELEDLEWRNKRKGS